MSWECDVKKRNTLSEWGQNQKYQKSGRERAKRMWGHRNIVKEWRRARSIEIRCNKKMRQQKMADREEGGRGG